MNKIAMKDTCAITYSEWKSTKENELLIKRNLKFVDKPCNDEDWLRVGQILKMIRCSNDLCSFWSEWCKGFRSPSECDEVWNFVLMPETTHFSTKSKNILKNHTMDQYRKILGSLEFGNSRCANPKNLSSKVASIQLQYLAEPNRKVILLMNALKSGKPPSQPKLYVGKVQETVVTLSWEPAAEDRSITALYVLAMSKKGKFQEICCDPGNSFRFEVGGLNPNTMYTFRLRAYNGFGRSVPRQIDLMTCPGSPEPPQLLLSSTNSLRIHWKSSSSKTGKDLKYAVEKQEFKDGQKIWKGVWCGHSNKAEISLLDSGKLFRLRLFAINLYGIESCRSNSTIVSTLLEKPRPPIISIFKDNLKFRWDIFNLPRGDPDSNLIKDAFHRFGKSGLVQVSQVRNILKYLGVRPHRDDIENAGINTQLISLEEFKTLFFSPLCTKYTLESLPCGQIQTNDKIEFTRLFNGSTNKCYKKLSELIPGNTRFRLRVCLPYTSSPWSQISFQVPPPPPNVPVVVEISSYQFLLKLHYSPQLHVEVDICKSIESEKQWKTAFTGPSTSLIKVLQLIPGTMYQVRCRTYICKGAKSSWSDQLQVETANKIESSIPLSLSCTRACFYPNHLTVGDLIMYNYVPEVTDNNLDHDHPVSGDEPDELLDEVPFNILARILSRRSTINTKDLLTLEIISLNTQVGANTLKEGYLVERGSNLILQLKCHRAIWAQEERRF